MPLQRTIPPSQLGGELILMAEVALKGRTVAHFGSARRPATAGPADAERGLETPTPVVAGGTETTDEQGRRLRWKDDQWWVLETVKIEDLADWLESLRLRPVGVEWPVGEPCPVVYCAQVGW